MNTPFPQAMSLDGVLAFLSDTSKGKSNDLSPRQYRYTVSATEFLGFTANGQLTDEGRSLLSLRSRKARLARLTAILVDKPVFSKVLTMKSEPDLNKVAHLVQTTTYLSDVTSRRRASTVLSWVNYLKAAA
jgi:hypothetical protein